MDFQYLTVTYCKIYDSGWYPSFWITEELDHLDDV